MKKVQKNNTEIAKKSAKNNIEIAKNTQKTHLEHRRAGRLCLRLGHTKVRKLTGKLRKVAGKLGG